MKAEKLKRIESQNLLRPGRFKGFSDSQDGAYTYMLNYWRQLSHNSKSLQESSEQLVREIDHRVHERDSLKSTLSQVLELQTPFDDTPKVSQMEELLSHRSREIELKEQRLAPLKRLEITALNALSRMMYKVSETLGRYVAITGVEEQVEFCAASMEKMLEEIIKASNLQRSEGNP